ncbi:MAG: exodeoxyribonuclease VII small subunit [Candidatus Marinimicrobia bacterium]|jgi:exodeoxyribonuclease VII small subunit|nr:exodeoxyribonuclease VII small subunit [Candidatus Neomarinimicrobiota bacterium]MBT3945066.1 exodeoxyribonuclease VII small subunit [Candidatus Neomarinimicrobiota bacterium]MBT4155515.1 exodeoxyribonuclease VII small subunit [Candidatus Neomarinimicrobiota bacterium]MBT4554412.1 exodeoxyribonuclease VII small subunit [Candidatus Neomarinimicrobiota bacterium]MBT4754017.1 exodeoxyribonuclease VII small subunit [Candidatus Neomarinimicrobiota bacterium]|tara:strand:+ start:338 stop:568 length:231 start_codon:yes stop_codon:yes gene_type:complete
MTKEKKQIPIEQSLERLESLVNLLESGEATLEESLNYFEEGMTLIKTCQNQLKDAEQKVEKLVKKDDGNFELKDAE